MLNTTPNHLVSTSFNATCPACGLLCDDIVIENDRIQNISCAKAIHFFEQATGSISPQIDGKNSSLDDAIDAAAKILSLAKQPLFAGLSTDLSGFKALYALAKQTNGTMQHSNAQSSMRNTQVLQTTGWQTTTLGEVKNRADLIVCIGTDVVTHNPRFFERFVDIEGMFVGDPANPREVIYIGDKAPVGANLVTCSGVQLFEVVAVLHALVLGKSIKSTHVAGIDLNDLQTIALKLKTAKYAVLTWITKDLDFPYAELVIEQITKIIATLNQTTRAAGLPLGGSDGDSSANHAYTWLNGLTLNYQANFPHDALVWVNSFNANKQPPTSAFPIIVLGNAHTKLAQTPHVFIPIATPGLDCSGTLFRVDSSVILPLKKVRTNALPTLSEVAHQIECLLT